MTCNVRLGAAAMCAALLAIIAARAPAQAQPLRRLSTVACPAQQQPLIAIPQIKYGADLVLRATLKVRDQVRKVWGNTNDLNCYTQDMRYFEGFEGFNLTHRQPWPTGSAPIPGPTLRAHVGGSVEIIFFNQIDPLHFAGTLDRGTIGTTEACDQYTSQGKTAPSGGPRTPDTMPDCLHGSNTTNVHFHGTHTTPSTTGDNVLLFVHPSLGSGPSLQPSEKQTYGILTNWFKNTCETSGPPKLWSQLPQQWQDLQAKLVKQSDDTTPYNGKPGAPLPGGLPASMRLTSVNAQELKLGGWPQYQMGANPYCFRLPTYNPPSMKMGQAPGTHWYHAHKHGSTALNVANGMTGALIIEGQYDADLHKYYHHTGLIEQVLMIQQLSTTPFPLITGGSPKPGAPKPRLSVNGALDPVISMKQSEVQMWRIVNGAFRDAVEFAYFKAQPPSAPGKPPAKPQCNLPSAPPPPATVKWRQIAQDGVQFAVQNYNSVGAIDNPFNLAPANRADILVLAPKQAGRYALCVVSNNALLLDNGPDNAASVGAFPKPPSVLLTVVVGATAMNPPMTFVPDDTNFPQQPHFLTDVTSSEIVKHRTLTFGPGNSTIDNFAFIDGKINQQMLLNTAEEWVVKNEANDKSHPFHIHINPFQILELFDPNNPAALNPKNTDGTPNLCYVDPSKPDTWDPARPTFKDTCTGPGVKNPRVLPGPWVWWDTFAIPTSHTIPLDPSFCQTVADCQAKLASPYDPTKYVYNVSCSGNTPTATCNVLVDGWFRMRSRFVDFTGQYVLHCHILIHEDRGMMQLIEVTAGKPTTDKSIYTHH